MVKSSSVLHSLTGVLRRMIFLARRTPFSMHSVMMGELPDTTKIAMVCTMVSSWKMVNFGNTISRVLSKRSYTELVMRRGH